MRPPARAVLGVLVLFGSLGPGLTVTLAAESRPRFQLAVVPSAGREIRFALVNAGPGSGETWRYPAVSRLRIDASAAVARVAPPGGVVLGRLVFALSRRSAPRDQIVVPLRRLRLTTAGGHVLADSRGARVELSIRGARLLSIRLPRHTYHPRIYLTGPGAAVMRFQGCGAARFEAVALRGDGQRDESSTVVTPSRLRKSGLCT